MSKNFCKLICSVEVMFFLVFFFIFNSSSVLAQDNQEVYSDERIIITLSNDVSRKLINYSKDDFPELELTNVIDLTGYSKNYFINRKNNKYVDGLDINKYNQTLCLNLKNKGAKYVNRAIDLMAKRKDVIAVGPDYVMTSNSIIPNDTYESNQWAINNIKLSDAWEITTGSNYLSIGVADSGIQGDHSDLSSNVDNNKSVVIMNGNITYPSSVYDDYHHGTHVAGIVGAKGNNNNGVAGCNWNSKITSLKVFDSYGNGYSSDLILALNYANVHNISIINFSGRWFQYETKYDSPVEKAIANYSGLFICAAGNENVNIDNYNCYPASLNLSNMIAVGASDENNQKCTFSNYGADSVDLFAPGNNIYSTYNDGSYASLNGTSMATPYVTGVASLIKSIRPEYTPQEIKKLILDNVDKLSSLNNFCKTSGKVNAYKAVRAATEQQTFISDVNGDGYNDMILSGKNSSNKRVLTTLVGNSNGSFSTENVFTSTRNFYYADRAYVGDFNGDFKSDIVILWNNGGNRQLLVYLGNSNGTFNEGVNLYSNKIHNSYLYSYHSLIMDVDNDGKDDFVVSYKSTNGKRCFTVYRGKSSSPYLADASSDALCSNYDYLDDSNIYSGDFNGDSNDDIIVATYNNNYKRQLITYTGNSYADFNEGVVLTSVRNHLPETYDYEYMIGNINGDTNSDFVDVFYDNIFRNSLTYNGTNNSPYLLDSINDSMLNYETSHSNENRFLGDVNGDGKDDLIIQYANTSGKRTFDVFAGNYNGQFEASVTTITNNSHNTITYPCSMYVSDINNDGRKDYIVKWKNGNYFTVYVYKGKVNYQFETCVSTNSSSKFYLG